MTADIKAGEEWSQRMAEPPTPWRQIIALYVGPLLLFALIFVFVNALPDQGTRARRYGSN